MHLDAHNAANDMLERRDPSLDSPPSGEDSRLFGRGVVEVGLELTPLRKSSSRGDVLFVGFISGVEIEVIFPGRRRAAITPLTAKLDRLSRVVTKMKTQPQSLYDLRYSVRALGSWRNNTFEDKDGALERRHQFLVARWSFLDADGTERTYGEVPSKQ